ncbi:methylenetetrahydrofolate reductase, partial [Gammaproteobacteria bacterium]|nr:methylenetetrahydrofolate reductase [Gammaproteobacteria bacterium]
MAKNSKTFSFEFFPPKTDSGLENLTSLAQKLETVPAEYFSVTFGAGGSTQQGTLDTCKSLFDSTKVPVAPHISGIGSNKESIALTLQAYKEYGFKRLVVLRGDLPSGYGSIGDFPYAIHLIEFIQTKFDNYFEIEVGAYPETHPEAKSPEDDIKHFCNKLSAGAKGAVTQFFFDADVYFRFVESCAKLGVVQPITPGIMPIMSKDGLMRMAGNCGAKVPSTLIDKLEKFDTEDDLKKFGVEYIASLTQTLLDNGAPGIHFYTINQLNPTNQIIN